MSTRNRDNNAMTPNEAIGKLIRRRRKAAGLSQTEFGELLRLHQAAVCRIEKGSQSLTYAQGLLVEELLKIPAQTVRQCVREARAA